MTWFSRRLLAWGAVIVLFMTLCAGVSVWLGTLRNATVIVYVGEFPQERNLILHDLGHGAQVRLTNQDSHQILPHWSPDGTQIAYLSDQVDGIYRVYVWHFYERRTVALTPPERDQAEAIIGYTRLRWSPDSRYVIATNPQTSRTASRVVQIAADGSTFRTLTIDAAQPYLRRLQQEQAMLTTTDGRTQFYWGLFESRWRLLRDENGGSTFMTLPDGNINAPIDLLWETVDESFLVDVLWMNGDRGIIRFWTDDRPPEIVVERGITPDVRP